MIGAWPIGSTAIADIGTLPTGFAGPAPFFFSDRGITFFPGDTRWPNKHFAPRVEQGLSLAQSIPISPLDQQRVMPISGNLSLHNADGGIDVMVSEMAIDGRDVEVMVGHPRFDGAQFQTLFKGTAGGWRIADPTRVELDLRDLVWGLDKPIQKNFYGGTGGTDGTADLLGTPKPECFGRNRNVPLQLVDPVRLIYQYHDGPAGGVLSCSAMGAPLTPAGDVADIMLAAPAPGFYATQNSGGYVRLGAAIDGSVSADVIGCKKWGVAPMTTAAIAYRILRDRLGLNDGQMDGASFTALDVAWPGVAGIYVEPQPTSAVQILNRLLGPVLGFMYQGRLGKIRVGSLALGSLTGPRAVRPVMTMDANDILEIGRVNVPDNLNPPYYRIAVGYRPNWAQLVPEDIPGQIIETQPDRYQYLISRQLNAPPVFNAAVQIRHPGAQDVYVDSLFDEVADATNLGQTIMSYFGHMTSLARVRFQTQGYLAELNDVIRLGHRRYGLLGGRSVLVVGRELDLQTHTSALTVMW